MKLTRILSLILALMMVLSLGAFASGEPSADPSGESSGEAKSVEEAYVDYIREWLQNELKNNDQMTQEQIDNEYMPLIEAGIYDTFPVSYLYDGWLNTGTAMTFEEFAAQYQPEGGASSEEPAGAASVEDAYYAYLQEFLEAELQVNSSMLPEHVEEILTAVKAGETDTFPGDILFNGMLVSGAAMTFDEFAAQY